MAASPERRPMPEGTVTFELGDSYADIERQVAGISLDDAVAEICDRVRALPTT